MYLLPVDLDGRRPFLIPDQFCESQVKLIRGLSNASKVEDLWTARLGTAYLNLILFS